MRLLTDYELDLVSGGWGSSNWWGTGEVWGYTFHFDWQDLVWLYSPTPGEGGGSGGAAEAAPEPNATPCVETTFDTGVSITDANRAALAASNQIAALDDETFEYSSIIWTLNGEVGFTSPYTDGRTDQVNWTGGIHAVPDGAVIIGIVHNHPENPYVDDRIPSGSGRADGDDWLRYDQLVNWNADHDSAHDLPRGITVDTKMLLYVYTNQDGKTHVYDKTDKGQDSPSCTLQ